MRFDMTISIIEGNFFMIIYLFIYLLSTARYLLPGGFVAGLTGGALWKDTVEQEK